MLFCPSIHTLNFFRICSHILKMVLWTDLVMRGGFIPRFLDTCLFEGRISDFQVGVIFPAGVTTLS